MKQNIKKYLSVIGIVVNRSWAIALGEASRTRPKFR